jgi:hypothetical protein
MIMRNVHCRMQTWLGSSSRASKDGLTSTDFGVWGRVPLGGITLVGWRNREGWDLLSLARTPAEVLDVICLIRPVALDDPLKDGSFPEFREAFCDETARVMEGEKWPAWWGQHWATAENLMGLRMVEAMGPAVLLLGLAAVLFAQLFVEKRLAFVGMLALMVLFAASADRVTLSSRLSMLADDNAPVETRVQAARAATTTFFYRKTADAAFEKMLANENTPASLRRTLEWVPLANQ